MNNDTLFLYIIAGTALCFGLINCIQFLLKRNKTAQTTGTIISVKMPNPETAKARNSKWAQVSYTVDGKSCQSQNRVQVPMTLQVGSTVKVRYDKFNPEIQPPSSRYVSPQSPSGNFHLKNPSHHFPAPSGICAADPCTDNRRKGRTAPGPGIL